jgi:glycosyltransferase involved in cell wall biosynthesis
LPKELERKRNILYLTYSSNIGGLEKMVLDLACRINQGAYAVTLCSFEREGTLTAEFNRNHIPTINIDKKHLIDIKLLINLMSIVKQKGIGIVHTHDATPWLYGALLKIIRPGIKLVHTEHSNIPGASKRLKLLEYLLSRVSNVVVADSQAVANFLTDKVKIGRGNLKIVYNGIDVNKFVKERKNPEPGLMSEDNNVIRIGITARLVPVKDHATLLRAFKLVVNEIRNAELWVIGDGELAEELKKLTRDLEIEKQVKYLGKRDDVHELLSSLEIFVLSSKSEGLSLAILEAMASALPVVATAVGGNPEIIVQEETGLLVPPGNPEKMAQAILQLLNDKNKTRLMGQRGCERVRRKFNVDKMVSEYQQIYEGLF